MIITTSTVISERTSSWRLGVPILVLLLLFLPFPASSQPNSIPTRTDKVSESSRHLQSVGTVTTVDIYNANTNQKVDTLTPTMIIDLSRYGLTKPSDLNFVAITSGNVGSVQFKLSGSSNLNRTDNKAPFAVCGNVGNDIVSCPSLNLGKTTLTYTTYEKTNRGGTLGSTSSIEFQIVLFGSVTRFDIYNAITNQKVDTLINGMVIVLKSYGLTKPSDLNFVAITSSNVGSVQFKLSGSSNLNTTENFSPFAVCGNVGNDIVSCPSLNLGETTLTYTTYEKTNRGGAVGSTSSIEFHIVLFGSVTGFDIYNAITNQKVDTLTPGKIIVLDSYGLMKPSDLNFVARTIGIVGSIQFSLSESTFLDRTENFSPFAVCGNVGNDIFSCPSFKFGQTTIKYTPFEKPNRLGMVGQSSELSFQITSTDLDERCNPTKSSLYFTGHDEASSILRGHVNITWSPAIAFSVEQSKFLWCGNVTYDIFVAQGGFNFLGANTSGPELTALANTTGSNMIRFETADLQIVVPGLVPGMKYSFLVLARTSVGHYSENRNQATLNISAADPIMKSSFTRMVIIPGPTDVFQVTCRKNESTVTFSGLLPNEVLELRVLDFVYFFDSDGNSTMAQVLSKTSSRPGGEVLWNYKTVDLTEVFDELDMDVDVTNSRNTDNSTDGLSDDIDELNNQELIAEFEALDDRIQLSFCLLAYPGTASRECYPDESFALEFSIKKLTRKIVKVYKEAKKVVEKIVSVIDIPLELSKTVNVLDIDRSAKLTNDGLEVGIKFDAFAKVQFSIKISLIQLVHRASAQLSGGYGLEGYLYFIGATSKSYKPAPLLLFEVRYTNVFFIGVVPIVITNRPSLSAYIEVTTAAEGTALTTASIGYDFNYELSYDRDRSDKFQKVTTVTRRPNSLPDPTFSLRLNATAEVGMILAWDFLLYEALQATIAVDVGLRSELEVGTNVEAMVITSPYFYILRKFEVEAFIRVRLMLGINNLIQNVIRQINFSGDSSISFGTSSSFEIPKIPPLTSILPTPLQEALEKAKADPILGTATSIALSELNSLVPDPYTDITGFVQGLDRDFNKDFTVWSDEFSLLGLPRVVLQAAPEGAQICQGTNAITLRVVTQQTRAPMSFLNGMQQNAMWFANFDGIILSENTNWIISPDRQNIDSVSLSLPRSAISQPNFSFYEIQSESSVFLRATPEILSRPKYSIFANASLKTLFPLERFECCDDSDCTQRFGPLSRCTTNKICRSTENRLNGFPSTIFVNQSSIISLTVDLTNLNVTDIDEFFIYRVDSTTNVVGTVPIVSLKDVGSGVGNDTVAGDLIYSNILSVLSTFAGESIGFQAVPVIRGVPTVNSSLTFLNSNITFSVTGNETNPDHCRLLAGSVDGLVLQVTYRWPADKVDLDSGTTFLGTSVGYQCGSSPYMNFTGDDIGLGGQETVNVFLGQSYLAGLWTDSTIVNVNAGWFQLPNRGPAAVILSTMQIVSNGTVINNNNLCSFAIDPGVQSGCASKTVATANITSKGDVTIIDIMKIR